MKKSTLPPSPKGLSAESRALWRGIVSEHELEDRAGLLLLAQACEAFDRLRQAQAILTKEGVVIHDRFGQPKQHPATLVERDARTQLLRAIKALNLDVELPGPMGRPPGK